MKRAVAVILMIMLLTSLLSVSAYALRAGGGGGGGGGGVGRRGQYRIIYDVVVIGGSAITGLAIMIKRSRSKKKSRADMKSMGKRDAAWQSQKLDVHVEYVYFAMQKSWAKGSVYSVRKLMSEKLYGEFCQKLDTMKKQRIRNVLENVQLLKHYPVSAFDHDDNSRDFVWYYIKGSMLDYNVDTDTNQALEKPSKPQKFEEYWKFVRAADSWVLDEIAQKDEIGKIDFQSDRPK